MDPAGPALHPGRVDDRLRLGGLLAGAEASYAVGRKWPVTLRISAGALIGAVTDTRIGTFLDDQPATYAVSINHVRRASYFYLGPEVRIGHRVGKHFEASFGVRLMVLGALTLPTWNGDVLVPAGVEKGGVFDADRLTGSFMTAILPGVAVRYGL